MVAPLTGEWDAQEVKDVQMQLEAAPAAAGSAGSPSAREGSVKDDGETTEDSDSDGATYSMGTAYLIRIPPDVMRLHASASRSHSPSGWAVTLRSCRCWWLPEPASVDVW
jgi:hypothetical protein